MARNVAPFVRRRARQLGLDERAVVAVMLGEGGKRNRAGDVGDLAGGGSYGPFQLYTQGALPQRIGRRSPAERDAWAWSRQGINYALRRIASVARGLQGEAAVNAIVRQFERPADPDASVKAALERYGGIAGGGGGPLSGGGGRAGAPSFAPQVNPLGVQSAPTFPDPRAVLARLSARPPEPPTTTPGPTPLLPLAGSERLTALRRQLLGLPYG